ncbi:hypothetical protein McanMca71_004721 [Microsporum canis]|uniref:Uncharacterized protein n=1 Tax=Arthroderma otae (strain ATCC MYA-4605 / CBS 113480) TaxID=554155 RepID=C5FUB4_ARTOC|nr:conserved hypothetical protein [Microsporum canis CBS 113480]EEQ33498.1 conserved hypothetical protein [Microsporum canis CBS 113480]
MADDFDSEMLSSTSSSPSARSVPQTPAGNGFRDNISGVAMPELSPPGSQGPTTREATMTGYNENVKESTTLAGQSMNPNLSEEAAEASTSQLPSILREEPGASWMSKKADEEAKRALEFVVDKEFSLKEFGDPFDDRDINPAQTK